MNISTRAENSKFLVDECFISKGLMHSAQSQLIYVLPGMKTSHLRLHTWLMLFCGIESVSGKKVL